MNHLMLQLQIAVNLFQYSSVTCCFFRSTYTLKKKIKNLTFVFLKNSIVNNNAKNESWKSNLRKGIIQWLKVVIYVQSHYSFKTHPHRKTNYSFSKSQSLPEELSLSLSSPSLSSALVSSVVSSFSSSCFFRSIFSQYTFKKKKTT